MRPTNPHLDMTPHIRHLPAGHPARETERLTPFQQVVFPMLLWFFDPQRHRGEGRSVLMAHVAIELAMRGYKVPLDDISQFVEEENRSHHQRMRYFIDVVRKVIHEHYDTHLFEFRQNRGEGSGYVMGYIGRRPR